jgi:hypothetical protein
MLLDQVPGHGLDLLELHGQVQQVALGTVAPPMDSPQALDPIR